MSSYIAYWLQVWSYVQLNTRERCPCYFAVLKIKKKCLYPFFGRYVPYIFYAAQDLVILFCLSCAYVFTPSLSGCTSSFICADCKVFFFFNFRLDSIRWTIKLRIKKIRTFGLDFGVLFQKLAIVFFFL